MKCTAGAAERSRPMGLGGQGVAALAVQPGGDSDTVMLRKIEIAGQIDLVSSPTISRSGTSGVMLTRPGLMASGGMESLNLIRMIGVSRAGLKAPTQSTWRS